MKGRLMAKWIMQPIGHIRSPYHDPKEVPRGLGAKHTAEGMLEVVPEMEIGLQDLDGFSHLILVWVFHRSEGYDLIVKPPSDNRSHGVFATHAPRRPNPIGITVVELVRREGRNLWLRGIDMIDGTPVLDIKPCTSSIPAEQLRRGWLQEAEKRA